MFSALTTSEQRKVAGGLAGIKDEMNGILTIGQKAGSVIKNFGKALLEGAMYGAAMFALSKGIEFASNAMQAQSIAVDDLKKKQQEYQTTQDTLVSQQNEQINRSACSSGTPTDLIYSQWCNYKQKIPHSGGIAFLRL